MGGGFGLKGGGVACFCLGLGGIADVVGVVEKRTFLGGKGYLLEGVGVRWGGVEGSYDVAEVMAPKNIFCRNCFNFIGCTLEPFSFFLEQQSSSKCRSVIGRHIIQSAVRS